jgi:serine/threonine protein phosphatase PrpC
VFIRPGIEIANLTDIGCHRPENEDYYCYAEPEDDLAFERKGRLAVVADGMGGHEGGQVASTIAVETVRDAYLNDPADDPGQALRTAFQNAHSAIQEYARQHPELHGMGTTCTAAALLDSRLCYAHVGDSRLYLIRGYGITRLTRDHSRVARLVQDGLITAEEAAMHPARNVLTAALGMEPATPGDFSETPLPLESGDILLLCTDGLHSLVTDQELLAMAASQPPADACKELVRIAKDRGGFDNITLQILKIA